MGFSRLHWGDNRFKIVQIVPKHRGPNHFLSSTSFHKESENSNLDAGCPMVKMAGLNRQNGIAAENITELQTKDPLDSLDAINVDGAVSDNGTFVDVLESVMKISLAGFGGAIAGLSVSRRRGALGAAAAASGAARSMANPAGGGRGVRGRPYVDQELPTVWGMACMAFAGIVEFSRLVSPTSMLIQSLRGVVPSSDGDVRTEEIGGRSSDSPSGSEWYFTESARTVGDYAVGGALAGGIFKGSYVQTNTARRIAAARKKIGGKSSAMVPPIRVPRTGVLSGLVPGAALGLAAGLAQVGIKALDDIAEERFGDREVGEEGDDGIQVEGWEDQKDTENTELQKSKEELNELENLSSAEIRRQFEELRGKEE